MYISGTEFVAGQVHLDVRWSGMIRGFPKLDILDLDHSAHAMSSFVCVCADTDNALCSRRFLR